MMDPQVTINVSEDPDFHVAGMPKEMLTDLGKVIGAEAFIFGYTLDPKTGRKQACLLMKDGENMLYIPVTPAMARRITEPLIAYAEREEGDAMAMLRAALEKPRT